MMQSYKYKQNLIDTDLLDYYHIINAPIWLYDKRYALQWLHKTTWCRLCMACLWPAYLMWRRPFLGHVVFANEKACRNLYQNATKGDCS